MKLRALRCTPASFTGDDLITTAVRAYHDWLKHTMFADALRQLFKLFFGEMLAGLMRIGMDVGDKDRACPRRWRSRNASIGRNAVRRRCGVATNRLAKQGIQTAAQPHSLFRLVLAHQAANSLAGNLLMSSRAKFI